MKRILIVDDNTEYLQILSSVLSGEFETITATGVEDALDTLQTITVDAICSDFNMKDGTGLDLLEKIRQQGLNNCASHSRLLSVMKFRRANFFTKQQNKCLHKPIHMV